jgi:branched-chain amino acid transport system permease protein
MTQDIVNALMIGSIYTLVAIGLTLIYGILDIVNFAHGELYMLGGLSTYFFVNFIGVPWVISIPLTMLVLALVGFILYKFMFSYVKDKHHMVAIVSTLGLSIALINLVNILWGSDPKAIPSPYEEQIIRIWGASFTVQSLLVIIVSISMITILFSYIKWSKMGKAMRAIAQDSLAASAQGIDIKKVASIAVSIGAALAGAAGSLIGPIFLVYPTMGLLPCLKAFVIVIVGGMGNIHGAVFGGFLLGFIEVFVTRYFSSLYRDPIAFVILIMVLILKPSGFFGTTERKA